MLCSALISCDYIGDNCVLNYISTYICALLFNIMYAICSFSQSMMSL